MMSFRRLASACRPAIRAGVRLARRSRSGFGSSVACPWVAWPLLPGVLFVMASLLAPTVVAMQDPQSARSPKATTIRGVVTAEAGRPVAGASVQARREFTSGSGRAVSVAMTAADGTFEVDALEPGRYSVSVDAPPNIVVDGLLAGSVEPGANLAIRMAKGGVITGRVSDAGGNPITGLEVIAQLQGDGRALAATGARYRQHGGLTDDRGVYRLWGLAEGVYVVAATGAGDDSEVPLYLADRPPTYHPSSNRAGAAPVKVGLGDEITGIDIVFRSEPAYRITGAVEMFPQLPYGLDATVELFRAGSANSEQQVETRWGGRRNAFGFDGVEDGDYELRAVCYPEEGPSPWMSDRVTVRVRGEDAIGVVLVVVPTSEVEGWVEMSPSRASDLCDGQKSGESPVAGIYQWVLVTARCVDAPGGAVLRASLDANGRFALTRLDGSGYRMWCEFQDEDLFVSSLDVQTSSRGGSTASESKVTIKRSHDSAARNAGPPLAIARDGLKLVRGQRVTGVRFVVARRAARVRGRVAPAREGESLPSRARVCLVPADPKQKDDVVHYYEVDVEQDGTFDVRNVAPGEYLVATRVFPNDDRPDLEILPAAWDPKERAALRAAAESAGIRVTLSPCQRMESAVVRLTP